MARVPTYDVFCVAEDFTFIHVCLYVVYICTCTDARVYRRIRSTRRTTAKMNNGYLIYVYMHTSVQYKLSIFHVGQSFYVYHYYIIIHAFRVRVR